MMAPPPPARLKNRAMPRFFFHIQDHALVRDDEGMELPDAEAARAEAMRGIRAMICDQVLQGRLALHHRVEIEDDTGAKVAALAFADAVRVEQP